MISLWNDLMAIKRAFGYAVLVTVFGLGALTALLVVLVTMLVIFAS